MPPFWEKVEHYNRKLIAPALILLLAIIVYEIFFQSENSLVELLVTIADSAVITIFVIDLIFLAKKAKSVTFFFRNYWLDVIAVFPFALFFNFIESAYRVIAATERLTLGQAVLHETVEVSREAKLLGKTGKLARLLRIVARSLHLITKSRMFTKVHHGKAQKRRKK